MSTLCVRHWGNVIHQITFHTKSALWKNKISLSDLLTRSICQYTYQIFFILYICISFILYKCIAIWIRNYSDTLYWILFKNTSLTMRRILTFFFFFPLSKALCFSIKLLEDHTRATQFILMHTITSVCNILFPVDHLWKDRKQRLTVLIVILKKKIIPYHK